MKAICETSPHPRFLETAKRWVIQAFCNEGARGLMLTEQHQAEDLSKAYIQAIAADAGVNLSIRVHDYGVDGTFHHVKIRKGRRIESGRPIDFQLKATTNWAVNSGTIVHDLEAKTYNDLVDRNQEGNSVRLILILLCLPNERDEWIDVSVEELVLRKCAYWVELRGEPKDNESSVRVRIPKGNLFNTEALRDLLQ